MMRTEAEGESFTNLQITKGNKIFITIEHPLARKVQLPGKIIQIGYKSRFNEIHNASAWATHCPSEL